MLAKPMAHKCLVELSAKRKQSDGKQTISDDDEPDDDEELAEEYASLTDEKMLEKASVAVQSEIGVKHPVIYDVYNLCEMAFENRLLFLRCSGKCASILKSHLT